MGKVPRPPIIKVTISPTNYSVGRAGTKIDQTTFHHIVGDANAAIQRFKTPGQLASSNYVIGSDGKIYQCVAEKDTSYADHNYPSNQRSITVEHAGGHPSVPYTEKMYGSAIRLLAWNLDHLDIKRFIRHRDVKGAATVCPGKLDVERIVKEAKKLRASYYKEKDTMLTDDGINVLFRFYRGDVPSAAQRKKYVGKITFDAMKKQIENGAVYKKEIAKAKAGTLDVKTHLPAKIRAVIKE